MVPVLSMHSVVSVAASSVALKRLTNMPLAANCCEPFAMLTVNIAGIATGTAVTNKISTKGSRRQWFRPAVKKVRL